MDLLETIDSNVTRAATGEQDGVISTINADTVKITWKEGDTSELDRTELERHASIQEGACVIARLTRCLHTNKILLVHCVSVKAKETHGQPEPMEGWDAVMNATEFIQTSAA